MNIHELAAAIRTGGTAEGRLLPHFAGNQHFVRLLRNDKTLGPDIFGPATAAEVAAYMKGFHVGVNVIQTGDRALG